MAANTLRYFSTWGMRLTINCRAPVCEPRHRIGLTAKEALDRWGDLSIEQIKSRFVCTNCGTKGCISIDLAGEPSYPMGSGPEHDVKMALYLAWERKEDGPEG